METELKLFQWDNATAEFMKQMVERVPIYIADLDPDFWDVAFPVPLSSPFVSEIEPFSHPMGLRLYGALSTHDFGSAHHI